jgi:hypothetical protein
MAVVGAHDFAPENAFRVDLLNAIEAHEYQWEALGFGDKDSTRTVTLRAGRQVEAQDYGVVNGLRDDVLAALDEHGYELALFQLGDKDDDRTLTVKATRNLIAQQTRIELP